MHPAPSIIVFTTLSGLGYGLAAVLGLGLLDPAALATKLAHLLALALIGAGLLSSTLHLGNPQRAWRAFSQWRSSWLSREGVLAVIGLPVIAGNAYASVWLDEYLPWLGGLATVLSLVTVFCTAMIYASLRSVQAWHTPLTPACYLAFASAGGFCLAAAFDAMSGRSFPLLLWIACAAIVVAWALKFVWWRRVDGQPQQSTAASATGLGSIGSVRLFEPPHMNGNYLTREMGFVVARKHGRKLRMIALVAGGLLPVALLMAAPEQGAIAMLMSVLAAISLFGGIIVERWLFFAEARHAVMSYYGR